MLITAPFFATAIVVWVTVSLSRENHELDAFLQSRRWVEDTIEQQLMSGSIPTAVEAAPARIIVLGAGNEVLFSSVPTIDSGARLPSPVNDFRVAVGNPAKVAVDRVATAGGREFQVLREMGRPPRGPFARRPLELLFPFAVFFLLLVASSTAGSLVMNRFGARVFALQRATRRIADGDLETPVRASGEDEITLLAADLDSMRRRLKEDGARRSRFLMGVSHDLATPLTTIKGYLEALRDHVVAGRAERGRTYEAMWAKAELLEERITELIGFVRLETGEWLMKRDGLDLAGFLPELAATFERDTEVLKRRFQSEILLAGPAMITADRRLLERVFENLFHNAVRYTREGDTIRLNARAAADGSYIIALEDSGPGLGEIDPETLFEPFTRGTSSRNEPGFGLGLATVRSILDSHGFRIRAGASELGGAAFTITIPAGTSRSGREKG